MYNIVVPVGLHLGPSFRYATPPDPVPEYYEVRFGNESEELTADEYVVWRAAFDQPERHAKLEITRGSVILNAAKHPDAPADPAAIFERLLAKGLLIEYDPDDNLEPLFRRHSLHPLAEGLGNTPDEPAWYHIGHNGQSSLRVNGIVYGIWAYSTIDRSIWQTCVNLAKDSTQAHAEGEDIDEVPPSEYAVAIARNLPMLVTSKCAFTDTVA